MTRTAVIGMALIVLALAGCTDNREIRSLKNKIASISDEVTLLNMRMKAVEQACLQFNTRLTTPETQGRAPDQAAPDSSRTAKDKIDSFASKPELNARLTRSSFSRHMIGMTIAETVVALGKPDKVSEESGAQQWIYNEIVLSMEKGGTEQSPALIVFEQGCVSRAVLTEKVQYSSEPKESEPSNAAEPTNQAAPTIQAVQTNQAAPTNE